MVLVQLGVKVVSLVTVFATHYFLSTTLVALLARVWHLSQEPLRLPWSLALPFSLVNSVVIGMVVYRLLVRAVADERLESTY